MTMESFRARMPVAKSMAYFDHAAVGPLPAETAQRLQDFAIDASLNGDKNWIQWAAEIGQLRQRAAQLLGASESEIALVSNTTHGIGIIAEGFPWRPGDNVVVPDNEFPSNLLPWRNLARRGVELRTVPIDSSGRIEIADILRRMDSQTRLVATSWIGFSSGNRIDVGNLVTEVHSRGALVFLDAIQGLGVFPLDVRSTGVDFLAADGHKWMLGPEGAGLLYIKESHLDRLETILPGWNSLAVGGFDPNALKLKDSAARYEGGSYNMAGLLALNASLAMLGEFGTTQISQAILANVDEIADQLQRAGFDVFFPHDPSNRSGILTLDWPNSDPVQARKYCISRNVILSVRTGRLRVSTHAYNNADDCLRLVDTLTQFRKCG